MFAAFSANHESNRFPVLRKEKFENRERVISGPRQDKGKSAKFQGSSVDSIKCVCRSIASKFLMLSFTSMTS